MKIKHILLTVAFLSVCSLSFARSITSSEALGYAEKFFHITHTKGASPLKLVWDGRSTAGMTRAQDSSVPDFYVFNLSGGGFVIISAETAYHPLVAYSLSESFEPESIPDNYRWLLDCIRCDIHEVRKSGSVAGEEMLRQWENIEAMANATQVTLPTAEWNQTSPYYNDCPKIGSSYCLTGCVATAFAILMHYHGYRHDAPTTPNNLTLPGYSGSNVTVAARSLDGHVYNFKGMPLTTNELNKASTTIRSNVAMLMRDVGQAFKMNYGTGSSGASTEQSVAVMSKYFKYAKNNRMEHKDAFSAEDWMSKVRNSIDNDNPVVVAASSAEGGGHCFILDGYDSNSLVRYNLGWGGSYHTVFTVLAETVNPQAYNKYAYDYTAVFNYRPDPDQTTEFLPAKLAISADRTASKGIDISNRPVTKGKALSVSLSNLINCDPQPKKSILLRIMKVDGTSGARTQAGNPIFLNQALNPGYYFPSLTLTSSLKISTDIKLGDYLEVEYASNDATTAQDATWALLDTPSDGSVVLACPLVPAFFIDLPDECACGTAYQLKLKNGEFFWAYNTDWSCESLTTGGKANIGTAASDTHIKQITFSTPGTYLVKATVNGDESRTEQVIAKIVAK